MSAPRPAGPYDAFRALAARQGRPAGRLMESLARAHAGVHRSPGQAGSATDGDDGREHTLVEWWYG
ncbi:hypothetical protein AB0D24_33370 [Streptomyces javensis]|uniref:hypothetical protein n=1 Tax=Streptomyces javensis TaxID=114698 RepID=UPI00340FA1B1